MLVGMQLQLFEPPPQPSKREIREWVSQNCIIPQYFLGCSAASRLGREEAVSAGGARKTLANHEDVKEE